MNIKKMSKEELESLSNKDITYYILEDSKKGITTADLFKEIIDLLGLPKSSFDKKIGDYYTSLSTDKRFIMLDDGKWDLKSRHTSDKIVKYEDSEEDEDLDEDEPIKEDNPEIEEDSFDDTDDDNNYNKSTDEEDLKDLVIIDEDELELEE